MKYPKFKFTREYVITGLDEQDAIERFQELLDEENLADVCILDAELWHVEEIGEEEID